jgi:hypothetical protein
MKRVISFMVASLFVSSVAMADCKEIYKSQKISVAAKSALSTTGGAALVGGGVATFYLGLIVGLLASNSGFIVGGLVAGGASTAGGIVVSVKGVKNGADFIRKVKAYTLIKQSYVGVGKYLNKVAEDLSEDLGRDITAQDVAAIVVEGDLSNKYCESKDTVFGIKDIKADIAAQF